jgi:hypothetical protein
MVSRPTTQALMFGRIVAGNIGRQLADEKFLDEIGACGGAYSYRATFEGQSDSIAILSRVVEVGNSSSRQISYDARVIDLPISVVALANNRVG